MCIAQHIKRTLLDIHHLYVKLNFACKVAQSRHTNSCVFYFFCYHSLLMLSKKFNSKIYADVIITKRDTYKLFSLKNMVKG